MHKRIKIILISLGIVLLFALIYPQFHERVGERIKAKYTAFWDVHFLINSLEEFKHNYGRYPNNEEGLQFLAEVNQQNNRPYVIYDPWGVPYNYIYPGLNNSRRYDLWTYGADKEEGGRGLDGDIYNWVLDIEGQEIQIKNGVIFLPYGELQFSNEFQFDK